MKILKRLGLFLLFLAMDNVTHALSQPLERVSYQNISGWDQDDLELALAAFRMSCSEIETNRTAFDRPVLYGGSRKHWEDVCFTARSAKNARSFFEAAFVPFRVHEPKRNEGLFTGYFEPEVAGSRTPQGDFQVPIYGKPHDLVRVAATDSSGEKYLYGRMTADGLQPYHTRRQIEHGALAGQGLEILWLKDWADAFFIQVQGAGRVRLTDGNVVRLGFAAKSGRPYTSIGSLLADRGIIAREDLSMQAIRGWMARNPVRARELMWENESFVFFREVRLENPELGPIGAQHVQLTPERSLAVDRSIWSFGSPIWVDTVLPRTTQIDASPYRRLLIAQDTGSAIRGMARGDVFWGAGERAADIAGHMKSAGSMIVLLPVDLVHDLGLGR